MSLSAAVVLLAAGIANGIPANPETDPQAAVGLTFHADTFLAFGPTPPVSAEDCVEASPGDSVPGVIACGSRPPVCVRDPAREHHGVLVYVRIGGADDPAAVDRVREMVARANFVIDREAFLGWGEHADLKVLCDPDGPDAGRPTVLPIDVAGNDPVETGMAGLSEPNARYWVFDPRTFGGYAFVLGDDSPGLGNQNLQRSTHAVFGDSHATALHEIVHSLGAVLEGAPHWNPGGHCIDGQDVMCYPTAESNAFPAGWPGIRVGQPGVIQRDPRPLLHGALFAPVVPGCEDRIHVDCNHDDYFSLDPEGCDPAVPTAIPTVARELVDPCWLQGHWNLGARANLFLRFSRSHDPEVALDAPALVVAGRETEFAASASDADGDPVDLVWDFGDGASATGGSVAHAYAAAGDYTVTVRAWDAYEGSGAATALVHVVGRPAPIP